MRCVFGSSKEGATALVVLFAVSWSGKGTLLDGGELDRTLRLLKGFLLGC